MRQTNWSFATVAALLALLVASSAAGAFARDPQKSDSSPERPASRVRDPKPRLAQKRLRGPREETVSPAKRARRVRNPDAASPDDVRPLGPRRRGELVSPESELRPRQAEARGRRRARAEEGNRAARETLDRRERPERAPRLRTPRPRRAPDAASKPNRRRAVRDREDDLRNRETNRETNREMARRSPLLRPRRDLRDKRALPPERDRNDGRSSGRSFRDDPSRRSDRAPGRARQLGRGRILRPLSPPRSRGQPMPRFRAPRETAPPLRGNWPVLRGRGPTLEGNWPTLRGPGPAIQGFRFQDPVAPRFERPLRRSPRLERPRLRRERDRRDEWRRIEPRRSNPWRIR